MKYRVILLLYTTVFFLLSPWNAKGVNVGVKVEYPNESVLAKGRWFKYSVASTGLHKLSFDDLKNDGVIGSSIETLKLRVYGNGTGDLPFANNAFHPTGLLQVPLIVDDGGDGEFGPGDALYFHANAADRIEFDEARSMYQLKEKIYDPFTYYFIGIDGSAESQKLVLNQATSILDCDEQIDDHIEVLHHEVNTKNLIKSGRVKYGEVFDFTTSRTFQFDLVNKSSDRIRYHTAVVAASSGTSSNFKIFLNNQSTSQINISVQGIYDPFRRGEVVENVDVQGNLLDFKLDFFKPNSSASGYLDEITLNYTASNAVADNKTWVFDYEVNPASLYCISVPDALILDVTDHNNVEQLTRENGVVKMLLSSNTRLLVATKAQARRPTFVESTPNQNLHAINSIDYLIVAPTMFMAEAERLAALHRNEGLKVAVVDVKYVYNEFSSGAVDIGGIRNFVKHLYFADQSQSNPLKYFLLFGDASYNNNFEERNLYLPTYQSINSESLTASYVTDDFFGFMESDNGVSGRNLMDVGVGRFPVSNLTEAKSVVDKVERYLYPVSTDAFGAWRNQITFVSDDQNGTNVEGWLHMNQANQLSEQVESTFNGYVNKKLYLDAFKQISTPGGERYPEANKAIDEAVENGSLIVNYTGHGGELGWAHERILDVPTINGWKNKDRLTLFVTATCEFSRFDDPGRISAGEYTLLNPNGGSIALFTTTRLVYSQPNFALNTRFYKYAIPSNEYPDLRLGDIMRLTKRDISSSSGGSINHLNFSLLGDPALRLNYPKNKVVTDKINGLDVNSASVDTIKALQKVRIDGHVANINGALLSDFNGEVEVVINDKKSELQTLINDGSQAFKFEDWDRVIYRGSAAVTNGKFYIEFIVPRDLVFTYGAGRLSYYAKSETTDANGTFTEFLVGGQADEALNDDDGPVISLFMNNTFFKPGDEIGSDGLLLAYLSDSSGINTTGNGIGHDIIAYLDNKAQNAVVLNSYFKSDLNSYTSGLVKFPLNDLENGEHTLTVRAWDINNNPSETSTRFIVSSGEGLTLGDLFNYPNPVSNSTRFTFKSNAGDGVLTATVKIYDSFGRLIDELSKEFTNGSFENDGLEWNINDGGQNISSGTFVYALELKNQAGEIATKSNTMVVFR